MIVLVSIFNWWVFNVGRGLKQSLNGAFKVLGGSIVTPIDISGGCSSNFETSAQRFGSIAIGAEIKLSENSSWHLYIQILSKNVFFSRIYCRVLRFHPNIF